MKSLINILIFCLFYFFIANISIAQTQIIPMQNGSITLNSAFTHFYDSGGETGTYQSGTLTMKVYPQNPSSEKLCVTFHEFQTAAGVAILRVFNGDADPNPTNLIAELSGTNYGSLSSSAENGALTFQFQSPSAGNTTTNFGWSASISVNYIPEDITMIGKSTWYVSSGRFYDNGGPQGNYSNYKDEIVTLFPQNSSEKVSVTFHECNISAGDFLHVFNGNSNDPALKIASLTGVNYGTISSTAQNGSLTFQFISTNTGSGWYASISTNLEPEDITMIANGTFKVGCLGRFYDNGGPQGNYGLNQNVVTTIIPANGSDKLSVTFHSFNTQANSDVLSVYNGGDSTFASLGNYSGNLSVFTVTSTAHDGSLTFKFVSNATTSSNEVGWYASISCSPSIPSYNMTTATYTIPSGSSAFFYDSGGPNGNYSNNESDTITFKPENSNDKISVTFNYFKTFNLLDSLEVRDGEFAFSPLLAILDNSAGYGTITATPLNTSGSLTFIFRSNNSIVDGGWAAVITNNATPKNISLPGTYILPSGSTGFFYDAGGPGGTYRHNSSVNNNTITIKPQMQGDKISVTFNYFKTFNSSDRLEIRDGEFAFSPPLAILDNTAGYGTITATPSNTSGSLTFIFRSNNSIDDGGWAAVITDNATPRNISLPGTYTIPIETIGFFYDAAGPGGIYTNDMNAITTIKPGNPGERIMVSFNNFQTFNSGDYLQIYDGHNTSAPLIGNYHSANNPGTIIASPLNINSTGSLTFSFRSNSSNQHRGWAATVITIPALAQVQLISPENDSVLVSTTVDFSWEPIISPFPFGITEYQHEWANNQSFTGSSITNIPAPNTSVTLPGLAPNTWWRVRAGNIFGWGPFSQARNFSIITDVTTEDGLPTEFALIQNYPNPFNPGTTIKFQIPATSFVELKVFDMLGKEVTTLVNEELSPGFYKIDFDGSGLASGVYFYRIKTGEFVQTKKLILQK